MRRILALALPLLAACAPAAPTPDAAPAAQRGWPEGAVPAAWPWTDTARATTSTTGLVASDHRIASEIGAAALAAGGNAVDAAVATALALAVVFPEAGNIGGGGFLLLRLADGTEAALDFRETAPATATPDMYAGDPGAALTGHLAAGVPGSVAGLWEAHRRFGRLPWRALVEPAIRLAEEGFVVDERFAAVVADEADRLARFAGSRELFLPGGRPPAVGSRWRNPDLGAVLRRIADAGRAGFYTGNTADLIVAEMRRGGGRIGHDDLRGYRPVWRTPIAFEYRGHRALGMPPPSSGGVVLALVAGLLGPWPLDTLGWHAPAALHLQAEALRRAFAVRNAWLADPDFARIPLDTLLSAPFIARLGADIDPDRATPSRDIDAGQGLDDGGPHTTHLSVVDAAGGVAALTTTVNSLLGSAVTVGGAGFVLNNEMDDFTTRPGEPNQFGLVQGHANAIAPGKRPLSSMAPTIVLSPDGRPRIVTGARGGGRILSAVFQIVSNVVDHGMDLPAAVAAPRIHHQHLPDVLEYERGGLGTPQLGALRALGHTTRARPSVGDAPSLLRRGDVWTGDADPRAGTGAVAAVGG